MQKYTQKNVLFGEVGDFCLLDNGCLYLSHCVLGRYKEVELLGHRVCAIKHFITTPNCYVIHKMFLWRN